MNQERRQRVLEKVAAKLLAAQRDALPDSEFALGGRRYPINDENHARLALAMVAKHGTPAEQVHVRRKVAAKYPDMGRG